MTAPHVAIIGAGVIGAALAYRLSRAGARVTVIEAGLPAGQATGRSFGWINASFFANAAHFRLRAAAIAAHRRLDADLGAATPTRWPGCLWWEEGGPALTAMADRLQGLGYPVDRLDRAALARLEPALADLPDEALRFPAEGATEAGSLARRLLTASDAALWAGCAVTAILTQAGRVTGVRTAAGDLACDHVVVAAGTGAPALVAPLGLALPMPDRPGVLVATRPLPPVLRHIIVTPDQEIRQDAAGRLIAPAAASHQADRAAHLSAPPGDLAAATLVRLARMFPGQTIRLDSATVGWRPVPADGLPVIGPAGGSGPEGLWLSVMHSGVTLAALVAEVMTRWILTGEGDPMALPFAPNRPGLSGAAA